MNNTMLAMTEKVSTGETINEVVNISIANTISDIVNNDICITIITTVIGIVAGFACSIKSRFWRNFVIVSCAVIFNVFMLIRMIFISEPVIYLFVSLVLWGIMSFFGN